MDMNFDKSVSSSGIVNTDLISGGRDAKFLIYLGSFVTSWMSRRCALGGGILVGQFTTFHFGKIHDFSSVSPFGSYGCCCNLSALEMSL